MNLQEISLFITEPIILIPEIIEATPVNVDGEVHQEAEQSDVYPNNEEEIPELETAAYEGNFQKGLLIIYQ